MMSYPPNYRYTREHEWIRVDNDTATVGITDHAQNQLGDIVYLDLPKVGDRFDAGQPLGTVESVKAVSDIYSPVSCEIVDVNAELGAHPELLNKDPHGAAWLLKVRLADRAQLDGLLTAAQYESYIAEESEKQ
jgi:glycine cleavage system H protein